MMNTEDFIIVIDGAPQEDADGKIRVWGSAYYAYEQLALLLIKGEARHSIRLVRADTHEQILNVDIQKIVKGQE